MILTVLLPYISNVFIDMTYFNSVICWLYFSCFMCSFHSSIPPFLLSFGLITYFWYSISFSLLSLSCSAWPPPLCVEVGTVH